MTIVTTLFRIYTQAAVAAAADGGDDGVITHDEMVSQGNINSGNWLVIVKSLVKL